MGLFLMRFWPVLIPFVVYIIWLRRVGSKATIDGKPVLRFRDGPWYWVVLSSLLIGIGCLLLLGSSEENQKGDYVPPHMKDGKMVPGSVESSHE